MSNNMLSQSDIDSLVANMASESPLPAAQPAAPAPAPAVEPAPLPPEAPVEAPAPAPDGNVPAADEATNYPVQKLSMKYPGGEAPPAMDSTLISNLQAQNTKQQERINRLETKVQKLEQMEKFRSGVTLPVTGDTIKDMTKKIDQLSEALKLISFKLQGTLGYDIYHSYTCDKCGTKEEVSTVYKCTHCGNESWLGWRAKH